MENEGTMSKKSPGWSDFTVTPIYGNLTAQSNTFLILDPGWCLQNSIIPLTFPYNFPEVG
jgi:hypothetical protein